MNNKADKGILYLIPSLLGDSETNSVLPPYITEVINGLDIFIAENERTARRFLRKAGYKGNFDETIIVLLNNHTQPGEAVSYVLPLEQGKNVGLLSEAGCPGIADPGAEVVSIAHEKHIRVVPLVGPSSILMALIASGFNGQQFAFHGYLPIDKNAKIQKIKELEASVFQQNQTQIFIETPYRNNQMLADLVKTCRNQTKLCVACDITLPSEYIATKTISQWKQKLPDLHKRPAVYLLYK